MAFQPFQREQRVGDVRIVAHPSGEEATATVPSCPHGTPGEGVKSRASLTRSRAWRSILEDECMPERFRGDEPRRHFLTRLGTGHDRGEIVVPARSLFDYALCELNR